MHPLKNQISWWRLPLSSWSIVERAAGHPCQVLSWTLSLNGLFKHLSSGCKTGVRPPGITATSIFRWLRAAFTSLVKWARNESHTNSGCWLQGVRGKHWRIHSFTPSSSIHPFLWKETRRYSRTTRSLGCQTPLKMTLGGSFDPSAATASVTEPPLFCSAAFHRNSSAASELQGTRWWKFKVHWCLIHAHPARCLAAMMKRWNCTIVSSMSSSCRWASIVFAWKLTECRFQFWYQPREALNAGSVESSFAFRCSINPLTAKPMKVP